MMETDVDPCRSMITGYRKCVDFCKYLLFRDNTKSSVADPDPVQF